MSSGLEHDTRAVGPAIAPVGADHATDAAAPSVLLIEDDAGILDAVGMALEFEGYRVATSPDGAAVDRLAAGELVPPAAILLDLLLADQNGTDLCRRLKTHPRTRHVPVLMTSAHPTAAPAAVAAGADAFLPKPFDLDDLLATLARFAPPPA